MSSTDSTRSRRIVFSLTDHCDGEFLYPPCRFESWAMLQHCGGSFAEILGGKRCQKASHCGEMIGELNAIRSTITDRIPGAQCVMLTLCLKSLRGHGADQKASSSKVVHAQKIEPLTAAELNQFIVTADTQIIEFLCTAKVTGIQHDDGWCYIGCSGSSLS
ncbi:unnamed protein product [Brassica napus]|uniref:(rape) hypothetical protein n=1 Tax=Brassica napus TaxID=3708 RepID=A0A816I672_BRANA|nr:unnamed protein product [Brassica napus]